MVPALFCYETKSFETTVQNNMSSFYKPLFWTVNGSVSSISVRSVWDFSHLLTWQHADTNDEHDIRQFPTVVSYLTSRRHTKLVTYCIYQLPGKTGHEYNAYVRMRMSNLYNMDAHFNANANHNPNPDPRPNTNPNLSIACTYNLSNIYPHFSLAFASHIVLL